MENNSRICPSSSCDKETSSSIEILRGSCFLSSEIRISLERKQDPLKISMEELVSLSQLDEGQIRELFSMAVRNGSVEKQSSDNG